jgi:hypothetical protein
MNKNKNGQHLEHGGTCWYKDGRLHRENGPAVQLQHYINVIPKNTVDKYGRSLLEITQQYKSKKSEVILLANGFLSKTNKPKM